MLSYRFMHMDMDGYRDGEGELSVEDVLKDFTVAPIKMRMEQHMLGIMYAPTHAFTLMGMLPLIQKKMDHRNRAGAQFTTASEGLGDIRLSGLYAIWKTHRQEVRLNAGISFPTGSIDESDDTPAGQNSKLPYPMQLGSGTFDLLPGLSYLGQSGQWSWGSQVLGTIRLGTNDNDYRLGHRADLTAWGMHQWAEWLSTSVRVAGHFWGDISGVDPGISAAMAPTGDPRRQGGARVDLLVGANVYANQGSLIEHRVAIEAGFPVYQYLEGPQLETDWLLTAGWQLSF